MAEQQDPTKAGPQQPEESEADGLAIEDLDRLIDENDPEFRSRLSAIVAEGDKAEEGFELLDLDALLARTEAGPWPVRLAFRLVRKVRTFTASVRTTLVHFVTVESIRLLQVGLAKTKAGVAAAAEGRRQFGFKPLRYKLLVFAFIGICIVTASLLALLTTKGLPQPERLFMQSIGEIADATFDYDAAEQETFYDSVRAAQNVFVIEKIVANLRRSPGSGSNPMAAAEFYIYGNSPDVVVEIKRRETEFRDIFMRTLEEFDGEELETATGKQRLLARLNGAADRMVTNGRVQKVLFKTFILKL